ncbi:hypothetical protein RHGRI_013925 [Rhododendron griersonianum]|uniref:Uncharacterized protein n=1 Tax=Rhododendron griersonianum TaxID=479676 RepID=A0AAV6K7Z6_9ERIC|nr:hypothetical protein RHGRI_013925 [Rhododendron griersonianum]
MTNGDGDRRERSGGDRCCECGADELPRGIGCAAGRVHEERAAAGHQRGGSPVCGSQLRRISGVDGGQLRRCCERGVDELPGGIGCAAGRVHEERAAARHRQGGSPVSGGQLRRISGMDGDRLRRNSTGSVPIWAGLRFLSEETIQECEETERGGRQKVIMCMVE